MQVRVTELGSPGAPELPVLMLHGIASPSSLFAPLVPYLGARYVVVVYWPGHGLSRELMLDDDESPRRHAVGILRSRLVGGRRANAASIAGFFRSFLKRGQVRPGVAISPAELVEIGQPVLMVWGERDVFLTPRAGAASARALPNGRLMRLDAGHAPWLEHEQEVGRAIQAFLAGAEVSARTPR